MIRPHASHLRLVANKTASRTSAVPRPDIAPINAVQAALHRVNSLMRDAVDESIDEPLRSMVIGHLETGGKQIRARTALEAAAALGIEPQAVVDVAAACEFLHNATLVHDDLQDGDTVRRGKPTVWVRHGMAQAINVGDVMLMMSTLVLRESECSPAVRWAIAEAISRRAVDTAAGQSLELALLNNGWLDRTRYLRAACGKSGPFFALPIEAAALCAGIDATQARAIGNATLGLGALFQVRDDILDVFGDKGRGDAGNDLKEGKVSALVVGHLEARPADREALIGTLLKAREHTTATEIQMWTRRFRESGGLERACGMAIALSQDIAQAPALDAEPNLRELTRRTAETILNPLSTLATQ